MELQAELISGRNAAKHSGLAEPDTSNLRWWSSAVGQAEVLEEASELNTQTIMWSEASNILWWSDFCNGAAIRENSSEILLSSTQTGNLKPTTSGELLQCRDRDCPPNCSQSLKLWAMQNWSAPEKSQFLNHLSGLHQHWQAAPRYPCKIYVHVPLTYPPCTKCLSAASPQIPRLSTQSLVRLHKPAALQVRPLTCAVTGKTLRGSER